MRFVPVILVVAVLATGAFLFWWFSPAARTKRALRRAPRVPIRDVAEGVTVEIAGRLAFAGEPLTAPLSGRRCAFWEVTVEQYESRQRGGHWQRILQETDSQDFFLQDDTGKALVRMIVPQVAISQDAHYRSGTFASIIAGCGSARGGARRRRRCRSRSAR